jgi:hypothetical protein
LELAFYFGDFEFAEEMAIKTLEVDSDKSFTTNSLRLYFSGLTYATLARETRRRAYRRKAWKCYKELTNLCNIKGLNSWHRCMVMETYIKSIMGGPREDVRVEATYDRAIQSCVSSGHIQDAGLASQLAAEYFQLVLGGKESTKDPASTQARDPVVSKYLNQARYYYVQWGATSLVRHLEQKYASLLPPLSSFDVSLATTTDDTSVACRRSITLGIPSASSQQNAASTIGTSSFPKPPPPPPLPAATTTARTMDRNNDNNNSMDDISVMTDAWKDGGGSTRQPVLQ